MQSNNRTSNPIAIATPALDELLLSINEASSFTAPKVGRKKRRDKGLPDESSRRDLARTYLEDQNRHWPELVRDGIVPEFTEENVQLLADDFRCRFLGESGLIDIDFSTALIFCVAYLRFSDPGSNPRSLDQQLRNVLARAKKENHFIPWVFVFADSGISGTIASRTGYQLAKKVLEIGPSQVRCLYIDEVGRMSRDVIETLIFLRTLEAKRRRLIGASDGTDSAIESSRLTLVFHAEMHAEFIRQLRKKVKRGMDDAFRRKKNIRPPSIAYKLYPLLGPDGSPVINSKGKVVMDKRINPETVDAVLGAGSRFVNEHWSPQRIARDFNERRIGNRTSWDSESIVYMLKNTSHIGIEYEGRTRKVVDPETNKTIWEKVPKEEWLRREMPHLRIMEDELFFRIQARLKECSEAFRRKREAKGDNPNYVSRATVYPKLLVRPICGHCRRELSLGSSGKYPTFCCLYGTKRWNDCPLRSYKSVPQVEKAILKHLRDTAFTADFLNEVVKQANHFLKEEALRPKEDPKPLIRQLKTLKRERDRLTQAVASSEGKLDALVREVSKRERAIKSIRAELRKLKDVHVPVPEALNQADILSMLADLKGLLEENIAISAPILRKVLGPIEIEPGSCKGSKRPVWVARFTLNLVPVLLHIGAKMQLPTTPGLEFLTRRRWKFANKQVLDIKTIPKYQQYAAVCLEMGKTQTQKEIARELGITKTDVHYSQEYGEQGIRPKTKPKRSFAYQVHAEEVFRLVQVDGLTLRQSAKRLVITPTMAKQAYDHQCDLIEDKTGQRPPRPFKGKGCKLDQAKVDLILLHIHNKTPMCQIHKLAGCSRATVSAIKTRIEKE